MKNVLQIRLFVIISSLLMLSACEKTVEPTVKIAMNPWPGYEFLYLAEQKGFYQQVGLNVKLLQLVSLADAQRAYTNNQVDGMASTLIEAVQAQPLGGKPLKIVLVPDYSNGGDVIVANSSTADLTQLKGKVVGAEISSLGIFVLERALNKVGLGLSDVTLLNVEQVQGEQAMLDGRIDAFVSYPPVSLSILKHQQFHKVFGSDQIPKEIIDTVSLSQDIIRRVPGVVEKLRKAWQLSIEFVQANKEEAYQLMAMREGISTVEFEETLADLIVLSESEQRALFESPDFLRQSVQSVCETLVYVKTLEVDCSAYPDIVYQPEK